MSSSTSLIVYEWIWFYFSEIRIQYSCRPNAWKIVWLQRLRLISAQHFSKYTDPDVQRYVRNANQGIRTNWLKDQSCQLPHIDYCVHLTQDCCICMTTVTGGRWTSFVYLLFLSVDWCQINSTEWTKKKKKKYRHDTVNIVCIRNA